MGNFTASSHVVSLLVHDVVKMYSLWNRTHNVG